MGRVGRIAPNRAAAPRDSRFGQNERLGDSAIRRLGPGPGPHPRKYAAGHRSGSATTTDTWAIAAVCRVSVDRDSEHRYVSGTEPRASPIEASDAAEFEAAQRGIRFGDRDGGRDGAFHCVLKAPGRE